MIGIGIDTGGTYTDAVVYDMKNRKILGEGKTLTTHSRLEICIANALDTLPVEYTAQAELLTLSTTLATNACVENKGSRAKLLLLGFETGMIQRLKDIYADYGFHDTSQFVVMDAKAENLFSEPFDPDWEELTEKQGEYFADCASVGIVQKHPRANGGRFEKTAEAILKDGLDIPITLAYDISDEVDILKCCAGTMLNARLIPLIADFIAAVKNVMHERGMDMPIAIVRSDGSLMSEGMARECPVETLLSGPAASVVGGSTLAETENAWIVDMGGTTTDIALLRKGEPVMADTGIRIGQWKTMVKGLYVDTFGLGGDSAVRYKDKDLYLDTKRVIPISLLASEYPYVLDELKELSGQGRSFAKMLHEFYVLEKDIEDVGGYTQEEQEICALLKEGPVITWKLAKLLGRDPYFLHTERLEEEGVIIKSGLTPTDMMILKGDFLAYNGEAAATALECIRKNVALKTEEIPDAVYELVIHKMYVNLARIFLTQKYKPEGKEFRSEELATLCEWLYSEAVSRVTRKREGTGPAILETDLNLTTEYPLVGVGAPIHIFLEQVAELFGTKAIVPEYAKVANALGAIAGRVTTRIQVRVKAEYKNGACVGYSVFEGTKYHLFPEYGDAEAMAVELAGRRVLEKSKQQGASDHPEVRIDVKKIKSREDDFGVLFETVVTATAADRFHG